MRLALFQPDIPQNTGTLIRLAACLGVSLDIIEPCGFPWDDKALKRAGLDYAALADVTRHVSWDAFRAVNRPDETSPRLVLLTTKSRQPYSDFAFRPDDILLLGRETAGVPASIHEAANARITVPMRPGTRSLNVAIAAAMVLGEALRQTNGFPAAKTAELETEAFETGDRT